MGDIELERRKLAEESVAIRLYCTAQEAFKINQSLKCSICFEIFRQATSVTNCAHTFCEDCIHEYLNSSKDKEPPCPVCQKPIRNRLRPADFQAKAAKLALTCAEVNTFSDCDGGKSPSLLTIFRRVTESTTIKLPTPNKNLPAEPDDSFAQIQKARKIFLGANNHKLPLVQPVSVKQGSFKTPLRTKTQNTAAAQTSTKTEPKPPDTREDLLDRLMRNTTYKRPNLPNKDKPKIRETAQDDELGCNFKKVDTIKWLHDNRNRFDCRPQSQENLVPELPSQELDMLSISQAHRRPHDPISASRISKQKLEVQRIRQKSKTVTRLARAPAKYTATRRTQSLHCDVKAKIPSLKRKGHSWAETGPNVVIEQSNSDEDVVVDEVTQKPLGKSTIVDMIEEKYLNSIDSEVLRVNKPEAEVSRPVAVVGPKRSKRIEERSPKVLPAQAKTKQNLSSGWTRIQETKTTLRKTERRTTKLALESKCTRLSTRSKGNKASHSLQMANKGKNTKELLLKLKPAVMLKRVCPSKLPKVRTMNDNQPTTRPYYLEQQEVFFNKFIKTQNVVEIESTSNTPNKEQQNLDSLENKSCSNQLVFNGKDEDIKNIATQRTNKGKDTNKLLPQLIPVVALARLDFSKLTKDRTTKDNEPTTHPFSLKHPEVFLKQLNKTQNFSVSKKTPEEEFPPNSPSKDRPNLENQDQDIKTNATRELSPPPTPSKLQLPLSPYLCRIKKVNEELRRFEEEQEFLKPPANTEIQNKIPQPENNSLSQPLELAMLVSSVLQAELNPDLKSKEIPSSSINEVEDNQLQSKIDQIEDQPLQVMDFEPTTSSNLFDSCSTKNQNKYSPDLDNDVFIHPTQPIITNSNERQENSEEEDTIFSRPTQPIIISTEQQKNKSLQQDNSLETNLNHKIHSLQKTLNTLKTSLPETNQTGCLNFIAKMEAFLVDIRPGNTKLNKLTKDADIQTDDVKDQSSSLSPNATTQTVLPEAPEAKCRHAAIQTDTCESSGGFRISATSMFKTQPMNNAHVQTDPLCCPKCKFVYSDSDSNLKQTSSDRVAKDSKLIKTLTAKYALSSSLDGIDFETQEIIKGKEIRGSGSPKSLQMGQKSCVGVDVGLTKNAVASQKHTEVKHPRETQKTQLGNVDSILQGSKLELKKTFKRIRKPSSDSEPDCEDELQEAKKNKFVQDDLSLHFASEEQRELSPVIDKEAMELLSDGSGSENNECYEACLKSVLKGYNPPSTPSTSTKQITAAEPPAKRRKTQDMIRECENIIREACSESIRIEHTENFSTNVHGSVNPAPSKLTLAAMEEEFQNSFGGEVSGSGSDDKGAKIRSGGQNGSQLKKYTQGRNKFSESLFTNTNSCAKNVGTEEVKARRRQEGLMEELLTARGKDLTRKHLHELVDVFYNDGEDDVDLEIAQITDPTCQRTETPVIQPVNNSSSGGKIRILQDIAVVNNNVTLHQNTNLTEIGANLPEENDCASQESDDLFLSDLDGIVETTPPKNKLTALERLSELSQAYYNPRASQILPQHIDELPGVISSIDPPPISDRNTKTTDNFEEKTTINQNRPQTSSLTPDLELPQTSQCPRERFQTSTPFREGSQITPPRSLILSPITAGREVNKKTNPIIAAQHSKYSPLTVVKSNTPPPPKPSCSSTAKQKSILSYMGRATKLNSSRSKNNLNSRSLIETEPIVNKKPVVSFTRLCQEKVQTIVSLSLKKLINFTDVLDASVTHLILEVDDENRVLENTIKYLTAVASGIWVLHFGWITECSSQNRIVPEEAFEALDLSGEAGPRKARLSRLERPLLSGYKFYVYLPSLKATDHEKLQHVLTLLGGEVVLKAKDLVDDGKVRLIISDPGCTQETEIYDFWLEKLHVVTVAVDWLTETVGQYQIASLLSFTECSKKTICDLGYPPELTASVSSESSCE